MTISDPTQADPQPQKGPETQPQRGAQSLGDRHETKHFIESHNVTKVSRKQTPGGGEESVDLSPTDASGERSSAPRARDDAIDTDPHSGSDS